MSKLLFLLSCLSIQAEIINFSFPVSETGELSADLMFGSNLVSTTRATYKEKKVLFKKTPIEKKPYEFPEWGGGGGGIGVAIELLIVLFGNIGTEDLKAAGSKLMDTLSWIATPEEAVQLVAMKLWKALGEDYFEGSMAEGERIIELRNRYETGEFIDLSDAGGDWSPPTLPTTFIGPQPPKRPIDLAIAPIYVGENLQWSMQAFRENARAINELMDDEVLKETVQRFIYLATDQKDPGQGVEIWTAMLETWTREWTLGVMRETIKNGGRIHLQVIANWGLEPNKIWVSPVDGYYWASIAGIARNFSKLNEHLDVYINGVYEPNIATFTVLEEGRIGNFHGQDFIIAMPNYPFPHHFKNGLEINSFIGVAYLRTWQDTEVGREAIKARLLRGLRHTVNLNEHKVRFFLDGFDPWTAIDYQQGLYYSIEAWVFRRLYYADPVTSRRFVDNTVFYENGEEVNNPFPGNDYTGEE